MIRHDDRQTQRCPVGSRFQFICRTLALPTRPVAAPCLPPSAEQSLPRRWQPPQIAPRAPPSVASGWGGGSCRHPPAHLCWCFGLLGASSGPRALFCLWRCGGGCWRIPGVNKTVRSGPCPAHSRSCAVSSCWEHLLACSRHRPGVCTGAHQLTPRPSCESGAAINPIYRVTDRLLGWNIQNC